MKYLSRCALAVALLFASSVVALADNVRTDYDHGTNFAQYHTYSWGQVTTSDPFYVDRIKQAVNQQLQAKGWQLVASGGSVSIFATDNVHNQKEVQTFYNGVGGGWGGGWGWGGWGWGGGWADPGFGQTTTTTSKQPVASLVIDLFDSGSKTLLWRGLATQDLSSNSNRNTKSLDGDIGKMFKGFPPKAGN
jgi:hypothetical protein